MFRIRHSEERNPPKRHNETKNNNNNNNNMAESTIAVPRKEHAPSNSRADKNYDDSNDDSNNDDDVPIVWSSRNVILSKCLLAGVVLYATLLAYMDRSLLLDNSSKRGLLLQAEGKVKVEVGGVQQAERGHRRLTAVMGDTLPSYMNDLNDDLKERKKLFRETPPEEVKYWFEYTGQLQVSKRKRRRRRRSNRCLQNQYLGCLRRINIYFH